MPVGEALRNARARFAVKGEAYGGGFRDRTASQSKGRDADRDGLVSGESWYTSLALGVDGGAEPLTGVEGNTGLRLGEFTCAALFVWASRRSADIVERNRRMKRPKRCNSRAATRTV